jgi:hypothetical protein
LVPPGLLRSPGAQAPPPRQGAHAWGRKKTSGLSVARMERPLCEHGSQEPFRVLSVLLLQPRLHWASRACIAAVGIWTRRTPAGALGPHASFRAHPIPFCSWRRLLRAGQGVQNIVRDNIFAPCSTPRSPGPVHDLLGLPIESAVAGFHLLIRKVARN